MEAGTATMGSASRMEALAGARDGIPIMTGYFAVSCMVFLLNKRWGEMRP